jgi:nucleotide-binding universal stress UspA family protein
VSLLVVGTDGSEAAQAAVSEALDLARRLPAGVVFASVSPPPPDYLGKPLWQRWVSEHLARGRKALDQARQAAEQAGIAAEYELLEGDPARELAKLAESRDADLLVVGTRGLGAVSGVFLGSVSSALVRRSRRPVVLVPEAAERAREEAAEPTAGVRAAPASA